jgi:hypothetical protein
MHADIQATNEFNDARIAVKSLASISTTREDPCIVTREEALSEGIDSVSGNRAEYNIMACFSDSSGIVNTDRLLTSMEFTPSFSS